MTVEFSLRQRAKRAQVFAIIWILLTGIILVSAYLTLPDIAGRVFTWATSLREPNPQIISITVVTLGTAAVFYACYLFGRMAILELALSVRFCAIADALCLSENDMAMFERSATILVPDKQFFFADAIGKSDLKAVAELVKDLK
jgi:hypothetical protein